MDIKNTEWFNTVDGRIGIVSGVDSHTGEPKAYIGICKHGEDEEADTNHIAKNGAKFFGTTKPVVDEGKDLLLAACKEFVRKVDCGEARSTRSYKQMKEAIEKAEQ